MCHYSHYGGQQRLNNVNIMVMSKIHIRFICSISMLFSGIFTTLVSIISHFIHSDRLSKVVLFPVLVIGM